MALRSGHLRTDKNNFGPRLGFAYRIPGSRDTVIRGGGGVFFGQTVSNTIGDTAALGFSDAASYVVAQAEFQSVFRLRDGFPAFSRQPLTPAFGAVPLGQRTDYRDFVLQPQTGSSPIVPIQSGRAARSRTATCSSKSATWPTSAII